MQPSSNGDTIRFEQRHAEERPVWRSIRRGILNTCPACGRGKLFRAFLKPVDACAACGERMDHQRAEDLPPYIVITIMGHLMLGGYMMTDLVYTMSSWAHLAIWAPFTVIGSVLLMQPVKGGVIGLQWAVRMHGFSGQDDTPADILPARDPHA
ncbi:DUF983 domain-containing protein [Pararhizobium sp.]|uniref:DUF983 domain-containing protein n=1 Tax=Pararhizobium sp. TaxID=1977563 RepID=UPI00271A7C93|nr:DUF983 domain-containing protein [Pararhizobium sp.]MDO9415897.1 DUF983 domain-containing protein [Pararhizobium sp.]